jgi:hypothetical protein
MEGNRDVKSIIRVPLQILVTFIVTDKEKSEEFYNFIFFSGFF